MINEELRKTIDDGLKDRFGKECAAALFSESIVCRFRGAKENLIFTIKWDGVSEEYRVFGDGVPLDVLEVCGESIRKYQASLGW